MAYTELTNIVTTTNYFNTSNSNINIFNDRRLKVKKVIYNDPATIVYFSDGSRVVVKRHESDEFDEQTGFLMCLAKKLVGTEELHRALRKNIENYD